MMKMKTLFIMLAAFVLVTSQRREYVRRPVKITVYYESECTPCETFLYHQLFPTYSDLKEAMTVELVPYGTTRQTTESDGSISLTCDHPSINCVQNKIQACAIQKYGPWPVREDKLKSVSNLCFLMCTLKKPIFASRCAVRYGFNHLAMAPCVNSVEGDLLLAGHAEKTKQVGNPVLKSALPIITVDGVYNETEQAMARSNLLQLVCSHLMVATHPSSGRSNSRMTSWTTDSGEPLEYPNVCHEIRAKVTMSHKNYQTNFVYTNNQMNCLRESEVPDSF